MNNEILFNGYWYTPDEAVAKMPLDKVIDKARDLMLWDERGDSLHRINDCLNRIEELTRWIPATERLPAPEDGKQIHVIDGFGIAFTIMQSQWDNYEPTHWKRLDSPFRP